MRGYPRSHVTGKRLKAESVSDTCPTFGVMFRAFRFATGAGAYWSVVEDTTYETFGVADGFLQYVRFSRGRAESTTRKYAEAIALYLSYCTIRQVQWTEPDMTGFQMWLRVAPSLRRGASSASTGLVSTPVRGDNHINLITYAVCEMFKFAAADNLWDGNRLGRLFERTEIRIRSGDRRHASVSMVTLRRRHRLQYRPARRRDAPVDVVKALIGECRNSRDVFLLAVLATTGLRRGELLGLRLSDLHLLPTSAVLNCPAEGPHLHVRPRENSNGARVKNGKPRIVPVSRALIQLYEHYRIDRDRCRPADDCDYVFVNLYRAPLGEPLKLHALNELFGRLSRRIGTPVTPHMLRHTFGTEAAQATTLDVVAELLGHADLRSTQTYLHPNMRRQRDAIEAGALDRHLQTREES